jgi:hypothetical protein
MILPEAYIVQKFYQYAGRPKYNRLNKTYQGGCCICREGKSWGRKRRFFYVVENNFVYCHNCGWSSNPLNWIKEVSGLSASEIYAEADNHDSIPVDINKISESKIVKLTQQLPEDSINLFDTTQLSYFKDDKVVKSALNYIKSRKLDVAVNRPKAFYLSLKDAIHKNRLVIPFYDTNGKILFYQSRTIDTTMFINRPKYLSKVRSDKSLFNIDNIDENIDSIYIFEGPIDACFVENGVALAGINETSKNLYTSVQSEQLNKFILFKKVIVLDSQWKDNASLVKTKVLLENGYSVFIWPKNVGTKFKDMNELAIHLNSKKIPLTFINSNTHEGLKGLIILSQIH